MSETELPKLEPCPFCGERTVQTYSRGLGAKVRCDNCYVEVYGMVREEAIERWNRRSPGGWLPIDSAPRESGHHLLLFGDGPGWTQCAVVGFWYESKPDDVQGVDGAWFYDRIDRPWHPTHWQPLPSPPVPSQEGASDTGDGSAASKASEPPPNPR